MLRMRAATPGANVSGGETGYFNASIRRMPNLTTIINELQQERDRLDRAIAVLTSLNGAARPRRRTMSALARRRIAAAQPARWARQKKATQKVIAWPKRRISPAGIARIRAAVKARWAKVTADGTV